MRNSAFYALAVIAPGTASCSEEPTQTLTAPGTLKLHITLNANGS